MAGGGLSLKALRGFPRLFWITNSMELIERGGYYAGMAILSTHMVANVGLTETYIGIILAIFMALLYFLPFIFGAIADKVGFKKMLILQFILMTCGFLVMGSVSEVAIFTLGLIILGVGAGGFKPIISSTIANITSEDQRSTAFAFYYWTINVGACFVPLLFGLYLAGFPGSEQVQIYPMIFLFSAGLAIINLLFCLAFYTNPKEPESDKAISQVFVNAATVMKDTKFFMVIVIYSGFWFMFAMNHSYLPLYYQNFDIMPKWFTPLLLAPINPGTIIIIGPLLAPYMEKLPSLQMMILGSCIFMAGLLILGLSPTKEGLIIGIIIFSIGEFLTHPNFISYVSKIAPKERLTIYMGYIFFATGIGLVLGTLFGGPLYEIVARNMERPRFFWGIVVSVGLVSTFFLMVYNLVYGTQKSEEQMAREEDKVEEEVDVEVAVAIKKRSILENKTIIVMPLFVVPLLLFGSFSLGTDTFSPIEDKEEEVPTILWDEYTLVSMSEEITGSAQENSEEEKSFTISDPNVVSAIFTLTWQDEPAASNRQTNEPDEFTLEVSPPENASTESSSSDAGSITISIEYERQDKEYDNGTGDYEVIIILGNCGDHEPTVFDPLGLRTTADNGNAWTLSIDYEYYTKAE